VQLAAVVDVDVTAERMGAAQVTFTGAPYRTAELTVINAIRRSDFMMPLPARTEPRHHFGYLQPNEQAYAVGDRTP
jgi:hypothetical protein